MRACVSDGVGWLTPTTLAAKVGEPRPTSRRSEAIAVLRGIILATSLLVVGARLLARSLETSPIVAAYELHSRSDVLKCNPGTKRQVHTCGGRATRNIRFGETLGAPGVEQGSNRYDDDRHGSYRHVQLIKELGNSQPASVKLWQVERPGEAHVVAGQTVRRVKGYGGQHRRCQS